MKKINLIWIVGVLLISSVSGAFQEDYQQGNENSFINEPSRNFEPEITITSVWEENGLINIEYTYEFYDYKNGNVFLETRESTYPQTEALYSSNSEEENRIIFNDFVKNETEHLRNQIEILQKFVKKKTQERSEEPAEYTDWIAVWEDFWAEQEGLEI